MINNACIVWISSLDMISQNLHGGSNYASDTAGGEYLMARIQQWCSL